MDQGIGVQHLHGAGAGQGQRGVSSRGLAESQNQHRPDPFSPRQKAVAHGLRQSLLGQLLRKQAGERLLYQALIALVLLPHGCSSSKGSSSGSPSAPFCRRTTFCSASLSCF